MSRNRATGTWQTLVQPCGDVGVSDCRRTVAATPHGIPDAYVVPGYERLGPGSAGDRCSHPADSARGRARAVPPGDVRGFSGRIAVKKCCRVESEGSDAICVQNCVQNQDDDCRRRRGARAGGRLREQQRIDREQHIDDVHRDVHHVIGGGDAHHQSGLRRHRDAGRGDRRRRPGGRRRRGTRWTDRRGRTGGGGGEIPAGPPAAADPAAAAA